MKLADVNPYIRYAEIQNAILEGERQRYAYDHRLFYVLENDGEIMIEGRSYRVRPDTAVFIPPAVGYKFFGKLKVVVINFDMTRVSSAKNKAICPPEKERFSPDLIFDAALCDSFRSPRVIDEAVFLKDALLDIVRTIGVGTEICDAESSARLKGILAELIKRGERVFDERDVLCSKIQGYIRLNAEKPIGNALIAKHFGYHPVYLGEMFKEKVGVTVYQAIINERIRIACRWLSQTEASVEEIAHEVGFSSRSHFCTAFKARTGMTPLRYRECYLAKGK